MDNCCCYLRVRFLSRKICGSIQFQRTMCITHNAYPYTSSLPTPSNIFVAFTLCCKLHFAFAFAALPFGEPFFGSSPNCLLALHRTMSSFFSTRVSRTVNGFSKAVSRFETSLTKSSSEISLEVFDVMQLQITSEIAHCILQRVAS